jgi:hypothetical protein
MSTMLALTQIEQVLLWGLIATFAMTTILQLSQGLGLLSYVHPRIASEYDGPIAHRRLEPPGFMGLHYGRQTPLVTLFGQVIYGTLLGLTLQLPA